MQLQLPCRSSRWPKSSMCCPLSTGFFVFVFFLTAGVEQAAGEEARASAKACVDTTWAEWSACSKTCGAEKGTRRRTSNCGTEQSERCAADLRTCPAPANVDCVQQQGSWGECSATCGSGLQVRVNLVTQQPEGTGTPCGPRSETKPCNTQECPLLDCKVGAWSDWTPTCRLKCTTPQPLYQRIGNTWQSSGTVVSDWGFKMRMRRITHPQRPGGQPCPRLVEKTACDGNGAERYFAEKRNAWSDADIEKLRRFNTYSERQTDQHKLVEVDRFPTGDNGHELPAPCPRVDPPPVDCVQNPMTQTGGGPVYKLCDVGLHNGVDYTDVGGGTDIFPDGARAGYWNDFNCAADCEDNLECWHYSQLHCMDGNCELKRNTGAWHNPAPWYCKRSGFTNSGDCHQPAWCASPCGPFCEVYQWAEITTFPANGGRVCGTLWQVSPGPDALGYQGQKKRCPPEIPCRQEDNNDWSTCSASCGLEGKQYLKRRVITHPQWLTTEANRCRDIQKARSCTPPPPPCPVDCEMEPWGDWGDCDVSCGPDGRQTRTRKVRVDMKANGYPCPPADQNTQTISCQNPPHCPVDCVLGDWTPWSDCSATCGPAHRYRARAVAVEAAHGGNACPKKGDHKYHQSRFCHENPVCDEDCKLSDWTPWSSCSVTCGDGGTQRRERKVLSAGPAAQGTACGPLHEVRQCPRKEPCPITCAQYECHTHNFSGPRYISAVTDQATGDAANVLKPATRIGTYLYTLATTDPCDASVDVTDPQSCEQVCCAATYCVNDDEWPRYPWTEFDHIKTVRAPFCVGPRDHPGYDFVVEPHECWRFTGFFHPRTNATADLSPWWPYLSWHKSAIPTVWEPVDLDIELKFSERREESKQYAAALRSNCVAEKDALYEAHDLLPEVFVPTVRTLLGCARWCAHRDDCEGFTFFRHEAQNARCLPKRRMRGSAKTENDCCDSVVMSSECRAAGKRHVAAPSPPSYPLKLVTARTLNPVAYRQAVLQGQVEDPTKVYTRENYAARVLKDQDLHEATDREVDPFYAAREYVVLPQMGREDAYVQVAECCHHIGQFMWDWNYRHVHSGYSRVPIFERHPVQSCVVFSEDMTLPGATRVKIRDDMAAAPGDDIGRDRRWWHEETEPQVQQSWHPLQMAP
ncbi:unnamed protein product [Amoebophrya sp. A120]|nr:unnamed protein product [Amoebophrya sp. A120]|eukprot:GSA120T00025677001.1